MFHEGLHGHAGMMERMSGLVAERRLPHAVLLTGPPGVGKSLSARFLAAAFLCRDNGCGACQDCRRVYSVVHPDFHLIEPDEGRRDILIAQTRGLMDSLASKSYEGGGKAAVIDPADRMNEESQNAFLKTLEEPPAGTLLVLVSSRPERLLSTVRSRSQQFRFGSLSDEEMEAFVRSRGDDGPPDLQGLAAGSPGRYVALLEAGGERIRSILADYVTSESTPSSVSFAFSVMSWAEEAPNTQEVRSRIKIFLDIAMALLRDVVVLSLGSFESQVRNRDMIPRLQEAAALYDPPLLIQALAELPEAAGDIEGYVDPALVVENAAALIRKARNRF